LESFKRNILGRCALLAKEYQVNGARLYRLPPQFGQNFVHGEGVAVFKPHVQWLQNSPAVGVEEALRGDGFGDRKR
jgi:hypothetical protein